MNLKTSSNHICVLLEFINYVDQAEKMLNSESPCLVRGIQMPILLVLNEEVKSHLCNHMFIYLSTYYIYTYIWGVTCQISFSFESSSFCIPHVWFSICTRHKNADILERSSEAKNEEIISHLCIHMFVCLSTY